MSELGDQGLNIMLSTTNRCGAKYPAPGIPTAAPNRWVDPLTGTVKLPEIGEFGRDVRPCNDKAEVKFSHKNGSTPINSTEAGIVNSLPGKDKRNYIVVFTSNLSSRYVDAYRPDDTPGLFPVINTEKIGKLGKDIDSLMRVRASW